ncbi:MAG: hypothetical protein ACK415_09735, partial [Thermodesulfovibrionales bacterium]
VLTYTEANVYSVQKDYTRWQFDQRRYKPLPYRDSNESTEGFTESKKDFTESEKNFTESKKDFTESEKNFTESKKDFYRKQEKKGVSAMPKKLSKNNDLEGVAQSLHKDIFKDIYKDISLRERLFERLKKESSGQDELALRSLRNRHPERVDFFLYLIETFKIDGQYVKNPIAYITSLRPIAFPSLPERESERAEKERQGREAKEAQRVREREYLEKERADVKSLVSSFVKSLN